MTTVLRWLAAPIILVLAWIFDICETPREMQLKREPPRQDTE